MVEEFMTEELVVKVKVETIISRYFSKKGRYMKRKIRNYFEFFTTMEYQVFDDNVSPMGVFWGILVFPIFILLSVPAFLVWGIIYCPLKHIANWLND